MEFSKILYLTPGCFDKGGISRYNRYQISALRELKGAHNVRVLSLLGPQQGDFEDAFDVYWNGWGAANTSKVAFILKTIRQVYSWKPDIIWLGHVNLTELLVRFNLFQNAISVLNVYGLEVWSGLRPKVEEGFRKVDYVISDCHFTANYVENAGLRPKDSIKVIWDCVDLEKFKPISELDNFYDTYNLPDPKVHPWILTLGRLSFTAAHKGYERLIEVFAKVAKKDKTSVLVFAGKGDMVEHLKALAKTFDVESRVHFSGMVHEDDMAKFYSVPRVFSLVSDRGQGRGEGIPLTPLEAMACGAPIIVGNQDGSQEAVFNDSNGYCIDPHDLELHAQHVLNILEDEALFEEKSLDAQGIAKRYFSYEHFKIKHQNFLSHIDD